jgi:hypothetical protein
VSTLLGTVTIARGSVAVTGWVNGVAKALDSQYGGYQSTARTARRATTTYHGVDVEGMTVPILFDGWVTQTAVTPQRRVLEGMASPSGTDDLTPPQPVFITGTVPMPNRWWVIQSLTPGDQILLRARDGVCLRQDYVVTVIQAPVESVILTNGKRYTVRRGDTLTSIAARQLGKASRWTEIKTDKGKAIRDPKSVKPGQVVRLP